MTVTIPFLYLATVDIKNLLLRFAVFAIATSDPGSLWDFRTFLCILFPIFYKVSTSVRRIEFLFYNGNSANSSKM